MKVEPDQSLSLTTLDELTRDRSGFQREFQACLLAEPGISGRVLDIGCAGELPEAIGEIKPRATQLDGVDPSAAVLDHPLLTCRWHAPFEDADLPENAYDLAYAYNVVEHISDPARFLDKVRAVLKPGGVFWALTPHGRHPFCRLSRAIELAGLKAMAAKAKSEINQYPAYYRLNTRRRVLAHAGGFQTARFLFMPCARWDTYFPRALRIVPHAYDWLVGGRFNRCMLIFAFRLQK